MNQTLSVVHDFEKELGAPAQLKALQSVLPDHIDVKQFCRLAVMAVQKSPSLLDADRQSLFQSLQNCAVDGLIPDGREAALVEFNRKDQKTNKYVKTVQYMPMVGGILKRVRQSGQISLITARCVYSQDEFSYWIDESGEHIRHVPAFSASERGDMILVYAMAKLANGEVIVEPMSMEDIEKVRNASRTGNTGPWRDWFERMAQKSVLHRIARRLPCSSDIAEMMSRDHFMYEDKLAPGDKMQIETKPPVQADNQPALSPPSEDDALVMNDIMGRIMNATHIGQLKDMAMEIDNLHPDFVPDAVAAANDKGRELEAKKAG